MKYQENFLSPGLFVSALYECVDDSSNVFKYTRSTTVFSGLIQKSLCRLFVIRENDKKVIRIYSESQAESTLA
jgi:hypothetical protein